MSNLITNYNLTKAQVSQNKKVETQLQPAKKQTAVNTQPLRPINPSGRLVNGSIIDAPAILIEDTYYDLKSIKKGLDGKSNDHQLGKVNDMGMKLGGLTLATYLFSHKTVPTSKAMEFVGWGSFFGSMALWPKIAIELPAYLINGFNVQKRYVDSMGRKKPVFQDPQYIPWDLYSDKEINKVGDKLGIPKDIKDRRNVTQEKMRKIATQNNTLWMLTAGFATPIMSALICNQAENLVNKGQKYLSNKKVYNIHQEIKNDFEKYVKNIQDQPEENVKITNDKKLNEFISKYKDEPLTEKVLSKMAEICHPSYGVTTSGTTDQLTKIFESPEYIKTSTKDVTDNFISDVHKMLSESYNKNAKRVFEEQKKYFSRNTFDSFFKGIERAQLSREELINIKPNREGSLIASIRSAMLRKAQSDGGANLISFESRALLGKLIDEVYFDDKKGINSVVKNKKKLNDTDIEKIQNIIQIRCNKCARKIWKNYRTDIETLGFNTYKKIIQSSLLSKSDIAEVRAKNNTQKATKDFVDKIFSKIYHKSKRESKALIGGSDRTYLKRIFKEIYNSDELLKAFPNKEKICSSELSILNTEDPNHPQAEAMEKIQKKIEQKSVDINTLDEAKIAKLKQINQTIENFNAAIEKVNDYQRFSTEQTSDSTLAIEINEYRSKLLNILGFSGKDIKKARFGDSSSAEVIIEKLENLTTNDAKYEETISKLSNAAQPIINKYTNSNTKEYENYVDTVCKHFAEEFKKIGLSDLANTIYGTEDFDNASVRYIMKNKYKTQIQSVISTILSPIQACDIYRRISNVEKLVDNNSLDSKLKADIIKKLGPLADNTIPIYTREEIAELAKESISMHPSDFETRFFKKRQKSFLDKNTVYNAIKVKDGKIIKSTQNVSTPVEINYDTKFYKDIMNFMFNSGADETTEKALKENGIIKEFENYKRLIFNNMGNNPPETKEDLVITDKDLVKEIGYDFFDEIKRCKSSDDLLKVLKKSKKYSNANNLQELAQKAGLYLSSTDPVGDIKAFAQRCHDVNINVDNYRGYLFKVLPDYSGTSEKRFLNNGQTFDECVYSISKEKFNTSKWRKIFGKAGIALLGITVATQFIFRAKANTSANKKQN